MMTSEPGPRIRSLDESIRHAHDATDRLEAILANLAGDLTGAYSVSETDTCRPSPPSALIYSADTLAGRLESLTRAASEVREYVVASNVVSVAGGNPSRQTYGDAKGSR
jgi:hypothetical protein